MNEVAPPPLDHVPPRVLVSVISGESASARRSSIENVISQAPDDGWKVALLPSTEICPQGDENANKTSSCMRERFISKVMDIATTGNFNSLLIELPDSIEPERVAEIFQSAFSDPPLPDKVQIARRTQRRRVAEICLDTMVSVVDASSVLNLCEHTSDEQLVRTAGKSYAGMHKLACLVGFADVIVLEHCEDLSNEDYDKVKKCLTLLNAEAGVLFMSRHSEVAAYEVLGRGDYMWQTLQVRQPTRKWLDGCQNRQGLSPISLSMGCNAACCAVPPSSQDSAEPTLQAMSIQIRLFRPFCPKHLSELLEDSIKFPCEIVRITGTFWLASQPLCRNIWSTIGASTEFCRGSRWSANESPQTLLTVIGYGMHHEVLDKFFDGLCLSEEECNKGAETWNFGKEALHLEPHVLAMESYT